VSLDWLRRHLSHAQEDALALGDLTEDVGSELADNFAARPLGLDDARRPEPADVPGDERLAEAYGVDQLAYGGRSLGQPSNDTKAVHVGECLVKDAQLAKIVGLIDDRGDGASEVRWRGQIERPRVWARGFVPRTSEPLYKGRLML
jgi:hypothetical protein